MGWLLLLHLGGGEGGGLVTVSREHICKFIKRNAEPFGVYVCMYVLSISSHDIIYRVGALRAVGAAGRGPEPGEGARGPRDQGTGEKHNHKNKKQPRRSLQYRNEKLVAGGRCFRVFCIVFACFVSSIFIRFVPFLRISCRFSDIFGGFILRAIFVCCPTNFSHSWKVPF